MPATPTAQRPAELVQIDRELTQLAVIAPRTPDQERRINLLLDKRLHHMARA